MPTLNKHTTTQNHESSKPNYRAGVEWEILEQNAQVQLPVANVSFVPTSKQIDAFVGSVREEVQTAETGDKTMQTGGSANEEARRKSQRTMIDAEKFRASIAVPPEGNISGNVSGLNDQLAHLAFEHDSSVVRQTTEQDVVMRNGHLQVPENMLGQQMLVFENNLPNSREVNLDNTQHMIPNIGAGVSDSSYMPYRT